MNDVVEHRAMEHNEGMQNGLRGFGGWIGKTDQVPGSHCRVQFGVLDWYCLAVEASSIVGIVDLIF